jgi:outer membrane protein
VCENSGSLDRFASPIPFELRCTPMSPRSSSTLFSFCSTIASRVLTYAAQVTIPMLIVATLPLAAQAEAQAQEVRIGIVNTERILRDSAPAKAAELKLKQEFVKRDEELQKLASRLKETNDKLERDSAVLAENERTKRQREAAELDRELQRRTREFREDVNQRKNEELSQVVERSRKVIRQVAEQEKYDLVVEDAIYFNARIDITDKVLRALNGSK